MSLNSPEYTETEPTCTWHDAVDGAALTSNDLRYDCPDGSFFSRFEIAPQLRIRCCTRNPDGCHLAVVRRRGLSQMGVGDSSWAASLRRIALSPAFSLRTPLTTSPSVRCCKEAVGKQFGPVAFLHSTFGAREDANNFWIDDWTIFKWQQGAAATSRTDAVRRLNGFKAVSLTPGEDMQPEYIWQQAQDGAALGASDPTYDCPDGYFLNRFETTGDAPHNPPHPLLQTCNGRSSRSVQLGDSVHERSEELVLGCDSTQQRSIVGIRFAGESNEITQVQCCRQVVAPTIGVILSRTSRLQTASTSEFAFQQNLRPGAATMLTGFTQPTTAHTRDIGLWQWSNFAPRVCRRWTVSTIRQMASSARMCLPPFHPVFRSNGIAFGVPAGGLVTGQGATIPLPAVTLNCSEGKVVHQWLLNGSRIDGRYYIGVGPGLKCCGVPNMVLTDCDDVVLPDANNHLQCYGYAAGEGNSPKAVVGGTYASGAPPSQVRCCSIQGDNSQPALS